MTARTNVERVLSELGLLQYVSITDDASEPDRVYGWPIGPYLRRHCVENKWVHDLKMAAEHHHGEGSDSFREPGGFHPALQVVFHPQDFGYESVELDLDFSAPGVDVVDTLRHAAEVIGNAVHHAKTDQAEIAAMLDKRFRKDVQNG